MVTNTRRVCEGSALAVVPTRGVAVERFVGSLLVWTADPLASGANRGLRVQRARRLREQRAEDAARRREVARGLAADRLALDGRDRFGLTVVGVLALREAEAATA